MLALLRATTREAGAGATLSRLADETSRRTVRRAARLGAAYAYLWAGQYAVARRHFGDAAQADPESPLADDARYAYAVAQWRSGDREGAFASLRALTADAGHGTPGRATASVVELDPYALLRAGLRRYRGVPLGSLEDQLVALLDWNGATLAGLALRRLAPSAGPPGRVLAAAAAAAREPASTAVVAGGAPREGPDAAARRPRERAGGPGTDPRARLLLLAAAAAVVVLFLWSRRRPAPACPRVRPGR